MKVKLTICLPTVAVMLLMMSVSGYAHSSHSHHQGVIGNVSVENPLNVTSVDKDKLGPEVMGNSATENAPPPSGKTSTPESVVSKWLEARATEEAIITKAGTAKSTVEAVPFQDMEIGGGWCNSCGCWLRHGCDSNGNCNNGHYSICPGQGLSCSLHSGDCISSG